MIQNLFCKKTQTNRKAANFALFYWLWELLSSQVRGRMTSSSCYHNTWKEMSGKHCCFTMDIYVLNSTQKKAPPTLKTFLSLDIVMGKSCYKRKTWQRKWLSWFKLCNDSGVCTGSFWKDDTFAQDQSMSSAKLLFHQNFFMQFRGTETTYLQTMLFLFCRFKNL